MKRVLSFLAVAVPLAFASAPARANVKAVDIYVGQLAKPASCFVQIDVKTAEQNMFNGQEKLMKGDVEIGSFQPLLAAGKTVAAGKSVLFGSPAFKAETGIEPDILLDDGKCIVVSAVGPIHFFGSFGPKAGEVTLPQDFGALDVVGLALLVHLDEQAYKVKSLTGEKEIGGAGTGSSGSSGASSGSSGASSSSGAASSSSGGTSGAPSGGTSGGGCNAAPRAPAPIGGLVLGLVLGAYAFRRKRRATQG